MLMERQWKARARFTMVMHGREPRQEIFIMSLGFP